MTEIEIQRAIMIVNGEEKKTSLILISVLDETFSVDKENCFDTLKYIVDNY